MEDESILLSTNKKAEARIKKSRIGKFSNISKMTSHEEKILELTDNAFKQLKIETELNNIDETWNHDPKSNLNIDKKNSKADNEEFYMIASTENIMELIEDHTGK